MNMPIKPSQALLAALALIAGPAFAQDAAAPAADAPAETAAPEAAPATDAPAETAAPADAADDSAEAMDEAATETATEEEAPAEPASDAAPADAATDSAPADQAAEPAEPAVGSYYGMSSHQDWTVRCIKADQGKDPCELYQLMQDQEGNSVAELTLIPLTNGDVAAGATLVAPLETDLIRGLGFSVDSGAVRDYPFSFCAPVGCVSRMGFTGGELAALKAGGKANVTLLPFGADPKQPVSLSLSLSGFTAAFDELEAYASKPAPEAPAEDAPATE